MTGGSARTGYSALRTGYSALWRRFALPGPGFTQVSPFRDSHSLHSQLASHPLDRARFLMGRIRALGKIQGTIDLRMFPKAWIYPINRSSLSPIRVRE